MLETLVSLVNFARTTLYYVIYYSYKTGFFLVHSLHLIFQYLTVLVLNTISLFTVLCESITIFIQDNVHLWQQFLVLLVSGCDALCSGIALVVNKTLALANGIIYLILSIVTGLSNALWSVFTSGTHVIMFLKKSLILFGSGVYFLITLIPLLIYYTCILSVLFIQKIFQEFFDICYEGASNIIVFSGNVSSFVMDVPVESLVGLIVAGTVAYMIIEFYYLITTYLKRYMRILRNWFRGITARPLRPQQSTRNHQPVRLDNQPIPSPTKQRSMNKSISNEERYCVICQERNKCVLLLPCRHLCLCIECTRELTYYNRLCPICRTAIHKSMKVYV